MNKKGNQQKEIGAANMLRFYDADLIERLNKRFNESGSRYEHRNHFLTDLIEAGLDRREYENSLQKEFLKNDAAMYHSIDAFAERFVNFEKYARAQFQSIGAANYLVKMMMSNIYFIAEAQNAGLRLSHTLLKDGKYDELPERFKQHKEISERMYVRDE